MFLLILQYIILTYLCNCSKIGCLTSFKEISCLDLFTFLVYSLLSDKVSLDEFIGCIIISLDFKIV